MHAAQERVRLPCQLPTACTCTAHACCVLWPQNRMAASEAALRGAEAAAVAAAEECSQLQQVRAGSGQVDRWPLATPRCWLASTRLAKRLIKRGGWAGREGTGGSGRGAGE